MKIYAHKIAYIQLWCSVIQAAAVIITFIFLTIQTVNLNQSLQLSIQDNNADIIKKMNDETVEINKMLMHDKELQQLFGYTKSDYLAFILINNFNEWFNLRQNCHLSDEEWAKYQNMIQSTSHLPWVKKILVSYYHSKDLLHPDFYSFLTQENIFANQEKE